MPRRCLTTPTLETGNQKLGTGIKYTKYIWNIPASKFQTLVSRVGLGCFRFARRY